jgi:hypothetical protein
MAWQSEETARRYRHVISQAEAMEQFQARFIARVTSGPATLPEVITELRQDREPMAEDELAFSVETEETLEWLQSLDEGRA